MKKLDKMAIIVYAGMIAQNVSALQRAALDLSTACDEINKIANKIAVAACVDKDTEISTMILVICQAVAFDLWDCEYNVYSIGRGIAEYIYG